MDWEKLVTIDNEEYHSDYGKTNLTVSKMGKITFSTCFSSMVKNTSYIHTYSEKEGYKKILSLETHSRLYSADKSGEKIICFIDNPGNNEDISYTIKCFEDSNELWSLSMTGYLRSGLVYDEFGRFFWVMGSNIVCCSAEGKILWKRKHNDFYYIKLATDGRRYLYTFDIKTGELVVFDLDGNLIKRVNINYTKIEGMKLYPKINDIFLHSDLLYVSGYESLSCLSLDGEIKWQWLPERGLVEGIIKTDSQGNFYCRQFKNPVSIDSGGNERWRFSEKVSYETAPMYIDSERRRVVFLDYSLNEKKDIFSTVFYSFDSDGNLIEKNVLDNYRISSIWNQDGKVFALANKQIYKGKNIDNAPLVEYQVVLLRMNEANIQMKEHKNDSSHLLKCNVIRSEYMKMSSKLGSIHIRRYDNISYEELLKKAIPLIKNYMNDVEKKYVEERMGIPGFKESIEKFKKGTEKKGWVWTEKQFFFGGAVKDGEKPIIIYGKDYISIYWYDVIRNENVNALADSVFKEIGIPVLGTGIFDGDQVTLYAVSKDNEGKIRKAEGSYYFGACIEPVDADELCEIFDIADLKEQMEDVLNAEDADEMADRLKKKIGICLDAYDEVDSGEGIELIEENEYAQIYKFV